jgi:hypothetical protein
MWGRIERTEQRQGHKSKLTTRPSPACHGKASFGCEPWGGRLNRKEIRVDREGSRGAHIVPLARSHDPMAVEEHELPPYGRSGTNSSFDQTICGWTFPGHCFLWSTSPPPQTGPSPVTDRPYPPPLRLVSGDWGCSMSRILVLRCPALHKTLHHLMPPNI